MHLYPCKLSRRPSFGEEKTSMQKRLLLPIEKKLILRDESPGRKRRRSGSFSDDDDIPSFNADDGFAEGNCDFSNNVLFQVRSLMLQSKVSINYYCTFLHRNFSRTQCYKSRIICFIQAQAMVAIRWRRAGTRFASVTSGMSSIH